MKKNSIIATIGFWLMLAAIVFGIATNGGLNIIMNFLHLPSFLVTVGGAFFAVMATAVPCEYRSGFFRTVVWSICIPAVVACKV